MQTHTTRPVHEHCITVRWADTDPLKHVNNVTWYRYISEARVHWLETLGALLAADNTSPVVAESGARFLRSAGWPDTIRIETYIKKIGNRSMQLEYRLFSEQQNTLCVSGFASIVWIDITSGQSVAIPDPVRRALSSGKGP